MTTVPGATVSVAATRSMGALLESRFGRWGTVVRVSFVTLLLGTYWLFFWVAHQHIGNPAFLIGLVPCLAAGALLGPKAAVVVSLTTTLLDSVFAQALPLTPETSLTAAIFSTINRLMLGVGVGLLVESRAHLHNTNTHLHKEVDVRKRREKSLEQSYRIYTALVGCLEEGVGLLDSDNRFLFANSTLCDLLELTPADLHGRPFSAFFTTPDRPAPQDGAGPDSSPRHYEVALKGGDGRRLLVTETLVSQPGTSDRVTLRVLRDVTARVSIERREKELASATERNQVVQSLAVLAGGVAHDLNNLLSGVVGNAELATLYVSESSPERLNHCLKEIQAFAMEAAQLSRQMLAYGGQRNLGIESLDVNAELREALRLLHATIDSRARLVLDLEKAMPPVAADKHQLRQVTTNLVLNGLEAMGNERGTLTIRTSLSRVSTERKGHLAPGDYVQLSITDTGHGVKAEDRERIFEPFFSTKAAGRGIGLAAALRIVRSYGGSLHIESTSSSGTTFCVLLPVAAPGVTPVPSSPRSTRGTLRQGCVLLIDNEPAVRIVTAKLLAELGQSVLVARDGDEGLELLRDNADRVNLVVLDLTMREQSGLEVLAELTKVKSDVKVVVTSGYHASDASTLLSTPNVIGFLEKPHTLARLEVLLASLPAKTALVPSSQVA